ncbi:MAG: DUF2911 domain-containing protein [Chitinophagaceae bacterium]
MKKLLFCLMMITVINSVFAQNNGSKLPPLDKSPMDMAYFPHNYPVLKIQNKATEPMIARVIYSRPQKNNRTIFGELVEYNKVWRLGANEATEIEFFKDVRVGGKKIQKGKYTMYALVNPDNWAIILNKETDIWGAFKYDAAKDVVRVNLTVQKAPASIEAFSMAFDKSVTGANLLIGWDDVMVSLPISLK